MSGSARRRTCAVIPWAAMLATPGYGEPAVGRFTFRQAEGAGDGTLAFCSAVRADPSVGLTLEDERAPPIMLTDVRYEEPSTSAPYGRRDD